MSTDTQSESESPDPATKVPLKIEDWLTVLVMGALALITFANVLARYFTSESFAWTEEISVFLMIALTLVGASAAVVSGFTLMAWGENMAVPLCAFVGAACATALIQLLAWRQGATVDTVVLFGIALLFSFEALLWLLQFIADSNALQQIVFWTMGSLGRATWTKIGIVGSVLLLCLMWSAHQAWALTALRAGEDQARSFGIAVERLRLVTLLRVSLLAAIALSFVGTIGFVGLVGPHIARMLLGEDHRHYLPGSALAGALMLSLASILSKALVPGVVLPIGIITALVGVPLFMVLVLRQRKAA